MRPHRRHSNLTRRRVRWRLLGLIVIIVGCMVGVVVVAHEIQAPRTARWLEKNAELSAREGKLDDAVATLRLYTAMNPGNIAADENLSILLARLGNPRADYEANNRLRQLLRRASDRPKARAALLELCLRIDDLPEAKRQADELEKSPSPDSPWLAMAQVYQATGENDRAAAAYEKALAKSPKALEVYQRYADLLINRQKDPQKAQRLIALMLANNPQNPMADLVAYVVRRDHKLPDADAALQAALTTGPGNVEVLLMAAGRELDRDPAKARSYLMQARKVRPNDIRVPLVLGKLLVGTGDYSGALTQFEDGFDKSGRTDPELAWRTAELLIELNRPQTLPKYLAALTARPQFRPVLGFLKARLDAVEGRAEAAKTGYHEARRALDAPLLQGAPPDYRREIAYKIELGAAGACFQTGDWEGAETAAAKASELAPNEPLPYLTLAAIHQQNREYVESANAMRTALTKRGCPPSAQFGLAQVLLFEQLSTPVDERNFGEFQATLDGLERTLPNLPELAQLKADHAIAINRTDLAIDSLRAGMQSHQNNVGIALSLIRTLGFAGKHEEALQLAARVEARYGRSVALALSVARIYLDLKKPDQARKLLDEALTATTADLKPQLELPLAQVNWLAGDMKAAQSLLQRLDENADAESYYRTARFDFELETSNAMEAGRTLDRPTTAVSEVRTWSSIWLMVVEGATPPAKLSLVAQTELESLKGSRPFWWGTRELAALAADLQGDVNKAIRLYRRALLAGPGYAFVADRLLQLQIANRRLADAADMLVQLRLQRFPRPADQRLAIDLTAAQGSPDSALKQAEQLAAQHAGQPMWTAWLARLKARVTSN